MGSEKEYLEGVPKRTKGIGTDNSVKRRFRREITNYKPFYPNMDTTFKSYSDKYYENKLKFSYNEFYSNMKEINGNQDESGVRGNSEIKAVFSPDKNRSINGNRQ